VPDKSTRGISNLPVAIPDIPDAPTVSAVDVGTSRAYNDGSATVTITSPTGGRPSSYSITTTPTTTTTTATSSPATITGLTSATSYTATVTPSNVSATGAATTSSSFTATTVPQAPTIGTFTDGGTGTTGTLSFTAGATGGSSITGYTYSTDGTNYSAASGTTSPFSLTGLTAGTYTFYLKATNANGTSLASTGVSGTVITPSSYESIASATGTGSSGTITFSSIPSTYKHLQIRYISKDTSTAADTVLNPKIQFNADTGNNYAYHELRGDGTSATTNAGSAYSGVIIMGSSLRESSASSILGVALVDILDYASTTKNKTVRYMAGVDTNGSAVGQRISLGSGLWVNTAAITSITINANISNFSTTSTFALYGIKG
jgi:hypothetical protein